MTAVVWRYRCFTNKFRTQKSTAGTMHDPPMNIPNILSLLRIVLVPVIVILLMDGSYLKALIVFSISGLTDGLDGFLAVSWNSRPNWELIWSHCRQGPFNQQFSVALRFWNSSRMAYCHCNQPWLHYFARHSGFIHDVYIFEIHPAFISKVTTMLQLLTVLMVLILRGLTSGVDQNWIYLLYWVTALFTILSGLGICLEAFAWLITKGKGGAAKRSILGMMRGFLCINITIISLSLDYFIRHLLRREKIKELRFCLDIGWICC